MLWLEALVDLAMLTHNRGTIDDDHVVLRLANECTAVDTRSCKVDQTRSRADVDHGDEHATRVHDANILHFATLLSCAHIEIIAYGADSWGPIGAKRQEKECGVRHNVRTVESA